MVAGQPDVVKRLEMVVPRDLVGRQMIVEIEDRQLRRMLVVKLAGDLIRQKEIIVKEMRGGHGSADNNTSPARSTNCKFSFLRPVNNLRDPSSFCPLSPL